MTGFEGGELERRYRQLQPDHDDAAARVAAVHNRFQDVETVVGDLSVTIQLRHRATVWEWLF